MKQCDTCIYGNKSECEKPCIVYKGENCELYEKRGDDMTREEAITELREMRTDAWTDSRQMEALDTAIKALEHPEQNVVAVVPCGDAISRQYLLDNCVVDKVTMPYVPISKIQEAPFVNPQEPKTGHWILTDDDFVYCSECEDSYYPRPIDASWYYCPHCGARMVEPQESEDKDADSN